MKKKNPVSKNPVIQSLPGPDPTLQQRKASNPDDIVWVSASAGSGKTTVLINRVLRLLLPDPLENHPGTPPHRLLCITYTKAAAAEMSLRLQKNLSDWAIIPEGDLFQKLAELTGHTPDKRMLSAARKLFADVLECPGGLKLMTIHSFCQSVLGRFPVEAGITPDFKVLDEAQTQELFSLSLEHIIARASTAEDSDLFKSFGILSPYLDINDLRSNIRNVLKEPAYLQKHISNHTTLDQITETLKKSFGLAPEMNEAILKEKFVEQTPFHLVRAAMAALFQGSKTLQKYAVKIQSWLDLPDHHKSAYLNSYREGLLTKKGTPFSLGKFITDEPYHAQALSSEAQRLLEHYNQLNILQQSLATAALMILANAVLQDYENRKNISGAMDYDDLIRKTDKLLQNTKGSWVHYKLDGGIDHVLMDEAQDTNPLQWNIIKNLSSEIFTGQGREATRPRSLFIVGDEKQSIFSFQGADPVSFDKMRTYFDQRSREAERNLVCIPLEVSFRTSPPVLKLVDKVFESSEMRQKIGLKPDQILRHYSRRIDDAGLVELWPLQSQPEPVRRGQWQLPFIQSDHSGASSTLAEQIAQEIWGWLQKKQIFPSMGRPVKPGDILILVRTRNSFVTDLIRHLKKRNLPVSGIDRLVLSDQIGVQDMLALARFARLAADDFSLACVLRSPFVDMPEDELMRVSLNRHPLSLWQALQKHGDPHIVSWLSYIVEMGQTRSPFEFFETSLNKPCPADPHGTGWRAMTSRLGEDVIDPLEEFISLSLQLEKQGIHTLEGTVLWHQKTQIEIKREMEEAGSQIRIMTVHASKGLEAPIVILPDTTSIPERSRTDRFLWPEKTGLPAPLWSHCKQGECNDFDLARNRMLDEQFKEHARLLYVALTRARDCLYVMGVETAKTQMPLTWYSNIEIAFAGLEGIEILENGRKRLSSKQNNQVQQPESLYTAPPHFPPPDWLYAPPPGEAEPKKFSPSVNEPSPLPVFSPLNKSLPCRFRRGVITHKLLQILPDLPEQTWEDAARRYIDKNSQGLPKEIHESVVTETIAVLRDSRFAPVFGRGSLAEVPITGYLTDGRLINGQIDRLIVMDRTILIVDYKTNRPSPAAAEEIPEIYIDQLRGYHDAMKLIYPNHLIKCAILWTDQPLLMPVAISEHTLDLT